MLNQNHNNNKKIKYDNQHTKKLFSQFDSKLSTLREGAYPRFTTNQVSKILHCK